MKTVVCTFCNSEIYQYTGPESKIEMKAKFFQPISSTVAQPQAGDSLFCPVCKSRFVSLSVQQNSLRMLVSSDYYGSGNVGKL